MIKSVDPYLSREFEHGRYTCWEFACDVLQDATGVWFGLCPPPGDRVKFCTNSVADDGAKLVEIEGPAENCLVYLEHPRKITHVGVYIRGRILHLSQSGAKFDLPEQLIPRFQSARYFVCQS